MLYLQALSTLVVVSALIFMSFLVLRSGNNLANKLFSLFVVSDSLWLVSVFFIIGTGNGANVSLGRLGFAAATSLAMTIQAFTFSLLHIRHSFVHKVLLYAGGSALFVLTLATSWIIRSVSLGEVVGDVPHPVYGSFYWVFVLYLVFAIVTFFYLLLKRRQSIKNNGDPAMKRQINVVIVGIMSFAFIGIFTNLIMPNLTSSHWPSAFAPVGSLVLAISFFYAISRYRLFDVKTAVVRSTTYALVVVVLALVFVLTVNITSSKVTTFKSHPDLEVVFNAAVALVIAISFQPLKRLFDKATNKYFFRDIYDTQEVLNHLNGILISNTDISKMLSLCEALIIEKLKLESCFFAVFDDNDKLRILGTQKVPLNSKESIALRKAVFSLQEKVATLGDIPGGMKDVHSIFVSKEISAVGKMISHKDEIGFVAFGAKKNGSLLSVQDLGVLNIVADQLAIATQNVLRFEEIEGFNVTLQDKIDEATKKLRQTNERLRLLDQTKDDFISMASHQLRTPLTSVKGYVSMVLDEDGGKINDTQRKLLTQSFISAQRMVYLISDLLNVSRLKTGKFVIEPVETSLDKVVGEELDQLAETIKSRGLELAYNKPQHFPVLMLDETKLRQVIMNFVDNAIYYTPSGGRIEVNLVDTPQSVEFTVVDNGIGVPRHEQHHLFTKFYRAHNARSARPDGTGLGLFMAKKVIVAQGGAIVFKSVEGKGSTFGFTFPKAKVLPKPAPKVEQLTR